MDSESTPHNQISSDDSVVFLEINPDNPVNKVASMCVNCGEEGMTTFMLTNIPHFKDIIVSSFDCEHCDYHNNCIQHGGSISEFGCKITCNVMKKDVCIIHIQRVC